jgi:hypothetical protein
VPHSDFVLVVQHCVTLCMIVVDILSSATWFRGSCTTLWYVAEELVIEWRTYSDEYNVQLAACVVQVVVAILQLTDECGGFCRFEPAKSPSLK